MVEQIYDQFLFGYVEYFLCVKKKITKHLAQTMAKWWRICIRDEEKKTKIHSAAASDPISFF